MQFDITQIPPTNEALGAVAKASQAQLDKLKLWWGLSLVGFLVGVIAVGACSWYIGMRAWPVMAGLLAAVVVPIWLAVAGTVSATTWVVSSTVAAAVVARLEGAAPMTMVVAAAVAALLTVLAIAFCTVYERLDEQRAALDALDELDPADCPQGHDSTKNSSAHARCSTCR
jgi:hypothetical protein